MQPSGPLPNRAAVRPRVRRADSSLARLLEEEVADLLEAKQVAEVVLVGRAGCGRSTALAHLAHVFADEPLVQVCDERRPNFRSDALIRVRIGVAASEASSQHSVLLTLLPWSADDAIEYLMHKHPDHVGRVVEIWKRDTSHDLHDWPPLCSSVLDLLAEWPEVADVRSALALVLARDIDEQYDEAVMFAITSIARLSTRPATPLPSLGDVRHWLRSTTVLGTLASQWILEIAQQQCGMPHVMSWDHATRCALQHTLSTQQEITSNLERMAKQPRLRQKPFVLGALCLHQPGYRPTNAPRGDMRLAWLHGIDLSEQHVKAKFDGANLSSANLNDAVFSRTTLRHANLRDARAHRTHFRAVVANQLDATGLDALGSVWDDSKLFQSTFCRASLDNASLEHTHWNDSDLSLASLQGALLTKAFLRRVVLDATNLQGANCSGAHIYEVDLRPAKIDHINLTSADLLSCNLESTELHGLLALGATFAKCDLTSASWPKADLRGANFSDCGLAHVDWQGADLRNADLRRATFHLGNSRSGLVDSAIASEGSRTGYYTDESLEDQFQSPEDVRKANLRDCDLRGAVIGETDFYLVDLRGAKMTPSQRLWFERCRAILDPVSGEQHAE